MVTLMDARFSISTLVMMAAFVLLPQRVMADAAELQGVYVIDAAVSDTKEKVDATIEQSTADLNFALRPLARNRIKASNPVYRRIALSHNSTALTVQFDELKPIEMPADGRRVPWTREDGYKFDVSGQWSGTQFVMTLEAQNKQFDRVNTFVLAPEGKALELRVRVTSPRLPQPILYQIAYHRETTS